MTVPSEQSSIQYDADGVSVSFPVPFRFIQDQHLRVTLLHAGVETVLVLGADYSVSGANDPAGGSITTTTAYPPGDELTIERIVPITQETHYQRNDPFPERAHEQALDKLTMICQQIANWFGWGSAALSRVLMLGRFDVSGSGAYRANNNRIQDLGDPIASRDAVHRQWVDARISEAAIDGAGQFVVERLADPVDPHNGAGMVAFRGDETVRDALSKIYTQPPFGRSGMRIVVGENYDAHYGWGGIAVMPSGKWVHIYRKGVHHGVRDGSELRARDSFDDGSTWTNDRLVCPTGTFDLRPDPPRMMADGRMGFLVNRQSEGVDHYSPWFVYTDDEGLTFGIVEITTSSPYTFTGTIALIDWPASQGGSDTAGFCAFGYLNAGGVDLLGTRDNGATWVKIYDVAVPSGDVSNISETAIVRLGTTDRWIMFSRARPSGGVGWRQMLTVFTTTNLQNWGPPRDAGLQLGGNPPGAIYDPKTGLVHVLNFARGGRPIDGFEQQIMHATADADALWAAGGDFAALGIGYEVMTPVPSWSTGYLASFLHRGRWYGTFTCGEDGNAGGAKGLQILIGDFVASGVDSALVTQYLLKRQKDVRSIELVADDNVNTTYPFQLRNASKTTNFQIGAYEIKITMGGANYKITINQPLEWSATHLMGGLDTPIADVDAPLHIGIPGAAKTGIATYSGSTASRKHTTILNPNGEVGASGSSGNTAFFNTTSDELLKIFQGAYSGDDAISIIKADPVRRFNWKNDPQGRVDVGWGAQTSYAISPDLATPGGWFDDEGNEVEPETEGAWYVPWGVDQSKRTPYLWAALTRVIERLEALEAREP